jgi:hypothetical protein
MEKEEAMIAPHEIDDFELWAKLAESDPDAFEEKRRQMLEAFIAQAPAHLRQRLERLQWRIDQERGKCSTPLSACVRLYSMMWDSVCGDNGLLWALQNVADGGSGAGVQPLRSAHVLPFKPREIAPR